MRLQDDVWLSGVLGFPCFKGQYEPAGGQQPSLAEIAAHGPRVMAFARIDTADIAGLEKLLRVGFRPVDVAVTLAINGSAGAAAELSRGASDIDVATPADADEVGEIAGGCFKFSRFHSDPHVTQAAADAVKREWARNACRGRAAVTYVARVSGQIAGFLAVLQRSGPKQTEAILDLIGVAPAFQGNGIGRALTQRFIADWAGRVDCLIVGTQAANIPALQLYESLGFRTMETAFVLHAHVRNGEVMA